MSIAIKQADISDYTVIEVVESEETEVVPENAGAVVIVKGEPGEDGFSPDISVEKTENGHKVTVTDKDGQESFDVDNGDIGPVGPQGLPGKTPNIQIGEVVTLEAGEEATASITGTAEEPRLNLGIPQGEQGKDGEGGGAEVTAESIENALGYMPVNPDDVPEVPTDVSAFNNDAGYAKKTELPTKTSELSNDSGFITADDIPAPPEVPVKSVFGRTGNVTAQKGDYTAEMVGADKEGKAVEEVGKHNVDENAHNDIRVELTELRNALEAFLDIDDPTLDQLSELIQKIEANAGTIEQLTNGKVNVSDIVNNLTTNVVNKPLSAAQGVALKGLVDELDTVAKGAKTTADEAKTAAQSAGTTATEAKNLASSANTTANNASNKVDDLEERMDSGEFKGEPGTPGADGVSIVSVEQTATSSADGGENVVTVTLSNGVKSIFKFKNGSKGSTGAKGNGIKSAVLNADYTLTLTFDDGTEYTSPSIRGAQGPAGKDGAPGLDGAPGADGYTPVYGIDYMTPEDKAEIEAYIATELAKRGQLEPEYAESLEWLEENGDQSKMYVLPDGFIYAWLLTEKEVETGGGYTNLIDGTKGYIKEGYRYSASSQAFKVNTVTDYIFASIVIPVPESGDLTIRVRGMKYRSAYPTIYGGDTNSAFTNCYSDKTTTDTYDDNGDWIFTLSNTAGKPYIVTSGELTVDAANVIATVNEEIVEGGTEIITEYAWASTGLAFIPADYEARIIALESDVAKNKTDIENLKKGVTTTTAIKDWDAPIYDANIPVFELSAEKAAMTNATNTPTNIYAKYDALMAKHPRYITKTDLGLCSDGVNHVYRYDFQEPEPHYESGKVWSETKAKAIIVTGIHYEWAGIYAMYNALEEIADNPELRNFRRNTHLIVVPCCNPYATIADNYQSRLSTPNSYGVRNANGVEIHRNFEVDWVLTEEGSTHYGGAEPLSEVETQYIDNIMKKNTDAALFLSCHNCGVDTFWGTSFIWASTATKYMCNMGYRVIDKLSDAWMEKYGDALSAGIEEYKTDLLEDGDTRLGWAGLSSSPGTEAKQATKYGIQGTNVEICDPFQIHGTKANPEPSMSAFTMSRGAETYVNFLLTAFGCYDEKDKALYS